MPFGQVVNLAALREITAAPPTALLATIGRWGIEVMRVQGEALTAPPNPLFAGLPQADPELLRRSGFQDSYEGLVVCRNVQDPKRLDLILIRDSASTYTLLHELVHAMLRAACPGASEDAVIETRFRAAWQRLTVYQRHLHDDPCRLLDPLWRRDILAAQADVARDLHDRIRFGQSQEVIAEKLLQRLIDERSPYFDAARRQQGKRYAEAMIDNAIELFNAAQDSRDFVDTTVRQLRAAILSGDLELTKAESLTDADVAAVTRASAALEERLAPTRKALDALKAFHRR